MMRDLPSVAHSNLQSLRERLVETLHQKNRLSIHAPATGRIIAGGLESRLATYVHEGDELVIVDDAPSRQLRISVAQDDFSLVERGVGNAVTVRIGTRPVVHGVIDRVIPRASRRLIDKSLAVTEGGTLPVTADDKGAAEDIRLTEQRFEAIVTLGAADLNLPIGERAYVPLGTLHESLASHLYDRTSKWLRDQVDTAQRIAQD